MEKNQTMMQFFEWYLAPDGNHWNRLKEMAPELKKAGIDSVWIPPVTKGQSAEDNGYAVYDLYDLGEFDQKGTVRTKYGTRQELMEAVDACHENGIKVYVDIVMNHKAGADESEVFQVVEVAGNDRNKEISEPFEIEGWTKFTFPNRNGHYSTFTWSFDHFDGIDFDARTGKKGVFRIVGENKKWSENVDKENGNYDYLMFADLDLNHPTVQDELIKWGKWLAETLRCDGYRMDAIKHMNYEFVARFISEMRQAFGEEFFFVGEYWNRDLATCSQALENLDYSTHLFDVSLHYKLHEASKGGREYDLQTIFEDTLVKAHPDQAVTFVDNHDTQPTQSLESWVDDWFKQSAYALILLRKDGHPYVFYGDYVGIGGDNPIPGKKEAIDPLLYVRDNKAYGDQNDYFDHPNVIGWVRGGLQEVERSGCAVVISNGDNGEKQMFVGEEKAGQEWVDFTGNREERVKITDDGFGTFYVNGGSVSVWAQPDEE